MISNSQLTKILTFDTNYHIFPSEAIIIFPNIFTAAIKSREEMYCSCRSPTLLLTRGFFGVWFCYVLYSTLLCRRMMKSNPGLLRFWHWQSDALTARLDLIHTFTISSYLAPSLSPVNLHSSTASCNDDIMTKRKIRKVLRQLREDGGGLRISFSVIGQCSLVPTSHWLQGNAGMIYTTGSFL